MKRAFQVVWAAEEEFAASNADVSVFVSGRRRTVFHDIFNSSWERVAAVFCQVRVVKRTDERGSLSKFAKCGKPMPIMSLPDEHKVEQAICHAKLGKKLLGHVT